MSYLGELAAIGASIMLTIEPIYLTLAGNLVGSRVVNRTRLVISLIFVMVIHWLFTGALLPLDAAPDRWLWLSLSGVIGFILGDAALLQAFLVIGPRLALLLYTLNPVIATIVAWLFMGETLTVFQILGIAITFIGVSWVLFESNKSPQQPITPKQFITGILLGVAAAAGQAGGSVTAKLGLYGDFPALSGLVIRVGSAAVGIWILAAINRKVKENNEFLKKEPKAILYLLLASFIGPILGTFFSLVALQKTAVGIASTLMSLQPIFMIPIGYFIFKEKVSWKATVGTLITILGAAIIFLV